MSVQKVDKTTGNTTLIAGATLWADSPIGTILAYGGATAPSGWFICDGTELTKTDYAELYAVIGDSFGTASVNTKFVLPDLREATTKGVGLTGKSNNHYDADGVALGEYIDDRIKAHEHSLLVGNAQKAFAMKGGNDEENMGYAFSSYGSVNSKAELTGSNTNEVKAVGVNFIIKAKQVALPADLESAVEDAVEEVYGDIIPSSASSSNKVLVSSDKTSTVTSGSTAPITSGGCLEGIKQYTNYNSTSLGDVLQLARTQWEVALDAICKGILTIVNSDGTCCWRGYVGWTNPHGNITANLTKWEGSDTITIDNWGTITLSSGNTPLAISVDKIC